MKSYPEVLSLYDEVTATITYVVYDPKTKDGVVIDTVLDYDPAASKLSTEMLEKTYKLIKEKEVNVHYILETHAHADHLSGAQWLKDKIPSAKMGIGQRITEVQSVFKKIYNLPDKFIPDGRQFDFLIKEGDVLEAGSLRVNVISTPGHTPACLTFHIGNALFTGDALFMPDTGTGRCDFPKGSSAEMYQSISKLYKLPDETRVFVGHDYKGNNTREAKWETTIGESKKQNIQLNLQTSEEEYRKLRDTRDATLAAPRLLLPSIQINIDAGKVPEPEENGSSYLKIPLRGVEKLKGNKS